MHKLSRGRQLRLICRRQLLVAAAVAAANVDVFPDVVAAPMLQLLMLIHTEKIDDKFNNTIFSGFANNLIFKYFVIKKIRLLT